MSDLVELQLSPIFQDFKARMQGLQNAITLDSKSILRREYATNVHQRFFRTGAGLQSTIEEIVTEGNKQTYRLIPQAFYMIFGEYGTGRRGAATGQPAPRGYRYGPKPGMAARRFGRIALATAKPEIDKAALARIQQFAANQTVN